MWLKVWDQFNQCSVEQRVDFVSLRGDEGALFMYHNAEYAGGATETFDIEVWKFVDGMAHLRCW
jgi:hypothetical protein